MEPLARVSYPLGPRSPRCRPSSRSVQSAQCRRRILGIRAAASPSVPYRLPIRGTPAVPSQSVPYHLPILGTPAAPWQSVPYRLLILGTPAARLLWQPSPRVVWQSFSNFLPALRRLNESGGAP